MANNTNQTGADTIRTQDHNSAGVKTTIVGIDVTPGATLETLMSTSNPMPVQVIGAVSLAAGTTFAGSTVNTSGTTNTATTLLAADTARDGLLITNRATTTLFVAFGFTCTTSQYSVAIPAGQTFDVPPVFAQASVSGLTSATTQPVCFTTAA